MKIYYHGTTEEKAKLILVQGFKPDSWFALNRKIQEFPNSDTFDNYTPHVTVTYIKSGINRDLL